MDHKNIECRTEQFHITDFSNLQIFSWATLAYQNLTPDLSWPISFIKGRFES